MFRLFFGIFMGYYRGGMGTTETDEDVEEETPHHGGKVSYYNIHEAPPVMTIPLIILAVLSVIGGFVGSLSLIGLPNWSPLAGFLAPVFSTPETPFGLEWTSTGLSVILGLIGIFVAWRMYGRGFQYRENKNPLYQLIFHKYYVDEALSFLIVRPVLALERGATRWLEGDALDGGSRGIAGVLRATSAALRRLQTGYVRNYALAILIGAVLLIAYYIVVRG
jgi:NADH-quinone oxidoreductase subunit L